MFQKVLIAEDHNLTHRGLESTLNEIPVPQVLTTQYCDDALLKIKSALLSQEPFELLITDLSFDDAHRDRLLTTGEELIEAIRKVQPSIKIIVFSIENRIGKIKNLFEHYEINGFVGKGREEHRDIKKALQTVFEGGVYRSQQMEQRFRSAGDINEIHQNDVQILDLLSKGQSQPQIASSFSPPLSLSSIEKRVNKLKDLFNAKTLAQLVSIAKDRGII